MRQAKNVTRMGEKGNACEVLVGKFKRTQPLRRTRHRWKDTIKMDLNGIIREFVVWMYMTIEAFDGFF